MPKYNVEVGEDNFGIFIEVTDANEYDELEDLLIEQYDLEVESVRHADKTNSDKFRIWLNRSIGVELVKGIINEINSNCD